MSTRRCSRTCPRRGSSGPGSTASTVEISEFLKDGERLARYEQHTIEVVVDRLVRRDGIERRLTDSVETALKLAEGVVEIEIVPGRRGRGRRRAGCRDAHLQPAPRLPGRRRAYEELAPRNFSFNSPYGACPACDGLGTTFEVDPELVVPNPDLSIGEGAISPWSTARTQYFSRMLEAVADANDIDLAKPWGKLTKAQQQVLLYGTKGQVTVKYKNRYGRNRQYSTSYEGVIPFLKRRHRGLGERLEPGADRDLHAGGPVPGLRRRPPQAVVARRDHRRSEHLRRVRPLHRRRRGVPRSGCS